MINFVFFFFNLMQTLKRKRTLGVSGTVFGFTLIQFWIKLLSFDFCLTCSAIALGKKKNLFMLLACFLTQKMIIKY